MIDLSTSHMTRQDDEILSHHADTISRLPRVSSHQHGYIVFVCSDNVAYQIETLRVRGHSDAFIKIYEAAATDGDCMLVNFDPDGEMVEGLEAFDW